MPVDELRDEPMMAHLLDSLEAGEDIGHYGRLAFAMIARHFMDEEEVIAYLTRDPDFDEEHARGLLAQVSARDYNPPKRERILEWMRKQEFPICPEPENASQCNVYRNLQFPQEVYEKISQFYESGDRNNN
jgi:DNA primase large subunit